MNPLLKRAATLALVCAAAAAHAQPYDLRAGIRSCIPTHFSRKTCQDIDGSLFAGTLTEGQLLSFSRRKVYDHADGSHEEASVKAKAQATLDTLSVAVDSDALASNSTGTIADNTARAQMRDTITVTSDRHPVGTPVGVVVTLDLSLSYSDASSGNGQGYRVYFVTRTIDHQPPPGYFPYPQQRLRWCSDGRGSLWGPEPWPCDFVMPATGSKSEATAFNAIVGGTLTVDLQAQAVTEGMVPGDLITPPPVNGRGRGTIKGDGQKMATARMAMAAEEGVTLTGASGRVWAAP